MNRQTKQMYQNTKLHGEHFRNGKSLKCSEKDLCTFFKGHFNMKSDNNSTPTEIANPPDIIKTLQGLDAEIQEHTPDLQ